MADVEVSIERKIALDKKRMQDVPKTHWDVRDPLFQEIYTFVKPITFNNKMIFPALRQTLLILKLIEKGQWLKLLSLLLELKSSKVFFHRFHGLKLLFEKRLEHCHTPANVVAELVSFLNTPRLLKFMLMHGAQLDPLTEEGAYTLAYIVFHQNSHQEIETIWVDEICMRAKMEEWSKKKAILIDLQNGLFEQALPSLRDNDVIETMVLLEQVQPKFDLINSHVIHPIDRFMKQENGSYQTMLKLMPTFPIPALTIIMDYLYQFFDPAKQPLVSDKHTQRFTIAWDNSKEKKALVIQEKRKAVENKKLLQLAAKSNSATEKNSQRTFSSLCVVQ